jgi:hypothetical protein
MGGLLPLLLTLLLTTGAGEAATDACTTADKSCSSATSNAVVSNGKPFVPFGMYYELNSKQSSQPATVRKEILKSAITDMARKNLNLMILYWCDEEYCRELLDHAAANNVKLMIYEETSAGFKEIANLYKDHPAFFGYFTSDDSNAGVTPGCYGAERKGRNNGSNIRKAIRTVDTKHAIYISPGAWANMERTPNGAVSKQDCGEIIGAQKYPIYQDTGYQEPADVIYKTGLYARALANKYNQAYLHNLQTWRYEEYGNDPGAVPTAAELRNMAYQAIAAGAQGFASFIYNMDGWNLPSQPALWTAVGNLGNEVKTIGRFIANARNAQPVASKDRGIIAKLLTASDDPKSKLLVVINTGKAGRTFSLTLPATVASGAKATLATGSLTRKQPFALAASGRILTGTIAGQDVMAFTLP